MHRIGLALYLIMLVGLTSSFAQDSGWELDGVNLGSGDKNIFGIALKSQIQIGPFQNGVELTIPFWSVPPILSYYWSIGINFRKRGRKLNAYDRTKGWQ